LYAATGDGLARLEEANGAWSVELSLNWTGAQCLAVDPSDPEVVSPGSAKAEYGGLGTAGVRGSTAGSPSPASSRSRSAR
jgi:hypothetical protein